MVFCDVLSYAWPDVIRSVTFCQVVTFDLFSEIAVYTIILRTFCLLVIPYFSLLHLLFITWVVTLCLFGFYTSGCQNNCNILSSCNIW